jgi:hypothetical protein
LHLVRRVCAGRDPGRDRQPLAREINKAMQAQERLIENGFDGTVTRTPEEFAGIVRADIAR